MASRLRPANDAPEIGAYLQWLHFAEGSAMFRGMMERMVVELAGENPPPMAAFIYMGGSRRVLTFAEETLAKHPSFAGDGFTAADIMMHFPLRLAPLALRRVTTVAPLFHDDRRGLEGFPHVNAFLGRMAARPAFQRTMKATMPSGPPAM